MRISVLAPITALVLLASGVQLATSATAHAATCQPTVASHCYSLSWIHAGMDAVGADLDVACLAVGDESTDFVTHEMWMDTNSQPGTTTWIEIGRIDGAAAGAPDTGLRWFWGDYRGTWDQWNQHVIDDASVNDRENVSIYYAGNSNWYLLQGGSFIGTSAANGTSGTGAQVGR